VHQQPNKALRPKLTLYASYFESKPLPTTKQIIAVPPTLSTVAYRGVLRVGSGKLISCASITPAESL
jgi:hypothetical protein